MPAGLAAIAAALALAIVLLAAGPRSSAKGGHPAVCDRVAGPAKALGRFVDRLRRGQTACLRAGIHEGGLTVRKPRVTLRSYPGERATIAGGQVRIARSARGATLKKVRLVSDRLSPLIYADRAVITRSSITNHHTATCVHVDAYRDAPPPVGVVIKRSRIHDCGRLPPTNREHGVYVAEAVDAVLRDNLIYGNADRGVQLYPDAQGTDVIRNVIEANGQGVLFGGGSDGSTVKRNIISNSIVRHNVESTGSSATSNVVRANCLWMPSLDDHQGQPANSGVAAGHPGFTLGPNVIADPRFVERADFKPAPRSPCRGFGPRRVG